MEEDTEELEENDEPKGAPVVLVVSTRVPPGWTPPLAFSTQPGYEHVQFLAVPNDDGGKTMSLFVSGMPGKLRGEAFAYVMGKISNWIHTYQLENVMMANIRGGRFYHPDFSIRPAVPDPTPPVGAVDSDPNSDGMHATV